VFWILTAIATLDTLLSIVWVSHFVFQLSHARRAVDSGIARSVCSDAVALHKLTGLRSLLEAGIVVTLALARGSDALDWVLAGWQHGTRSFDLVRYIGSRSLQF
jgi:hypothetical protein